MSLCEKALEVLTRTPDVFLSAIEVGTLADGGKVPGFTEAKRWERALLALVDGDRAWPRNDPDGPRTYRVKARPAVVEREPEFPSAA
jgi:hypothetical protein